MPTTQIGPFNSSSLIPAVVNDASATITAVSSVAGKLIRVYRLFLVVGGVTNLTFQDGSTPQSGPLPMIANGSVVLDIDGTPWFWTSGRNNFEIANSGSVQVSGTVYYSLDNA